MKKNNFLAMFSVIFAFSFGVAVESEIDKRFGYKKSANVLKIECEKLLPRNEKCIMQFVEESSK